MAVTKDLRCPSCAGIFPWLFMNAQDTPKFCPLCGFNVENDEPDAMPSAPHIDDSAIKKAVDQTYRATEEGSQHRAHMAREMGADQSEADSLKITNMRDNAKQGETSDIPVVNDVSRQMDMLNSIRPGSVGFHGNGAAYGDNVTQGPFPNAGARAQQSLRKHHANYTSGSGQVGATTSTMPALETQSPAYRSRV